MNKPYISSGNRKMSFPTFSLPAGKTCPGKTKACCTKCYARKAEIAYPQVLPCRKNNLKASKQSGFAETMIDMIAKRKGVSFFRVHESGDFYSQSYLESWFEIARAFPSIRFLAFTKSFALDYSACPSNLQIIWSVWPDTDLATVPAGPRSYAGDSIPEGEKPIECPGNCDGCGLCWSLSNVGHNVHFAIH